MNEEVIVQMLLKHEEGIEEIKDRLDGLATKEDWGQIQNTLDEMVGFMKKSEQERMMVVHGMRRHEDMLDKHEKELNAIKPIVGLV